jgi:hypothetical protein
MSTTPSMSADMAAYIDTKTPERFRIVVRSWCFLFYHQCEGLEVAQIVAWLLEEVVRLKANASKELSVEDSIAILPVASAYLHKATEALATLALTPQKEEDDHAT